MSPPQKNCIRKFLAAIFQPLLNFFFNCLQNNCSHKRTRWLKLEFAWLRCRRRRSNLGNSFNSIISLMRQSTDSPHSSCTVWLAKYSSMQFASAGHWISLSSCWEDPIWPPRFRTRRGTWRRTVNSKWRASKPKPWRVPAFLLLHPQTWLWIHLMRASVLKCRRTAFMHINSSTERERVHQRTCVLFINILQNLQKKKNLKLSRRGKQLPGWVCSSCKSNPQFWSSTTIIKLLFPNHDHPTSLASKIQTSYYSEKIITMVEHCNSSCNFHGYLVPKRWSDRRRVRE